MEFVVVVRISDGKKLLLSKPSTLIEEDRSPDGEY